MGKHKLGSVVKRSNGRSYRVFGGAANREYEHRLIAARALGRPLPPGVEVHHFDGNGLHNEGPNLVICPNAAYHKLLHMRQRALEACGNANWRLCGYCHQYDAVENLRFISTRPRVARHVRCATLRARELKTKLGDDYTAKLRQKSTDRARKNISPENWRARRGPYKTKLLKDI